VVAAHPRYASFADFGDAEAYRAQMEALNEKVRKERGE
jgi:hypothetical protein